MRAMPRLALIVVLVALLAAGACLLWYPVIVPEKAKTTDGDARSRALMALTLPDIAGSEQKLSQWREKVLVVNFWATWCAPCRKEIPAFAALSRHYAAQPVQFVGVSIDSSDNVERFREEHAVPYPLLIGSARTLAIAAQLGNTTRALPFTVILNRQGAIDHIQLGVLEEAALRQRIDTLLAE